MNIVKVNDGEVIMSKNGIIAKRIFNSQEAKVIHMHLDGGARVETHTTPINVLFYILEGKAWVEIGDERHLAEKDTIIESPKDIPHALENFSNTEILRVMITKLN